MLRELDEGDFDAEVGRSPIPVLVDFWGDWCPPCKLMLPELEAAAARYAGAIEVVKVDADKNAALAERFGVRSLPTLIVLKDGEVRGQVVGAVPRARLDRLIESAIA